MKNNIFKSKRPDSERSEPLLEVNKVTEKDIAIIGIGCRMAGAMNVREYWEILRTGTDCIRDLPSQRKLDAQTYNRMVNRGSRTELWPKAGYMSDIGAFDYKFFNISPKEAAVMDPNQRIFLETVWHAIEDAGYGEDIVGSQTGIYAGHSSDFGLLYKDMVESVNSDSGELSLAGNIKSIIASRISYLLDLKGPSLTVDTACSSSLSAVYLACQDIRNGKCHMALAGGVKVNSFPSFSKVLRDIGIHSPSDKAKSFDHESDGTSFGEGSGVVMLKSLHHALLDGDHIYAVIKGGAMNQDGASINITAPNMLAQQDVIMEAWKDAQVDPNTITYIEAHGTGTKLGDPIEVQAITNAFKNFTERKQFCAIGTVKTNIGHLDHAAGIAGLIKAALSLKHKSLVASLHFQSPNRKIDFANSAVYINTQLSDWNEEIRRCGISSFGLSGTNCHLVLEQAPEQQTDGFERNKLNHFIALSAKNERSLNKLVEAYSEFALSGTFDLYDLCYTANVGRFHHASRIMLLFRSKEQLIGQLQWLSQHQLKENRELGIFSNVEGEGKFGGDAASLVTEWLAAGEWSTLQSIAEMYVSGASVPWKRMYPGNMRPRKIAIPNYPFLPSRAWFLQSTNQRPADIHEVVASKDLTIYKADISVEQHWYIREHVVDGEYMLPGAAMLHLVKEAFAPDKGKGVVIQDVVIAHPFTVEANEPKEIQVVFKDSGSFTLCSRTEEGWVTHAEGKVGSEIGLPPERVDISELLAGMEKSSFNVFDISNKSVVTGGRWENVDSVYTGSDEVCLYLKLPDSYSGEIEDYFIHPSLMDNAVHVAMFSEADTLFLPWMYREIKMIRRMPSHFYSYIRKTDSTAETITMDITWLNEHGEVIAQISDYCMKKVHRQAALPTSSFLHEVVWNPCTEEDLEYEGRRETIVMIQSPLSSRSAELKKELQQKGHRVIELLLGEGETNGEADKYVIPDLATEGYDIIGRLAETRFDRIVYALGFHDASFTKDDVSEMQSSPLFGLFHITKALLEKKVNLPIELDIIATYANEVTASESYIHPLNAALCGLGKSVTQEYPEIRSRFIDVDHATSCERIAQELFAPKSRYQVALREGIKYRESIVRLSNDKHAEQELPVKENGTYLITGGLGGLGIATAQYLAEQCPVNLILISKTPLPPREMWNDAMYAEDSRIAAVSKSLREIEALGSSVDLYHLDISIEQEMSEAYRQIKVRHCGIDGIFHCAGVAGDGYIIRKSPERFMEVVAPKITGTLILNELTKDEALDFFVLFSSVTAMFAGVGQGDYTAANMFLDAFAANNNKLRRRTISINWPAWKRIGMAHRYDITDDRGIFLDLAPDQALTLLDTVLRRPDIQRAVIGQYNRKLPQSAYRDLMIELGDLPVEQQSKEKRKDAPISKASQVRSGEGDNVAYVVASLWTQVLGESDYQMDDNFFEVGGNSIIATSLLRKLQNEYPSVVSITDIFTYPTIQDMSHYIQKKLGLTAEPSVQAEPSESQLDGLLDQLISGEIDLDAALRKL